MNIISNYIQQFMNESISFDPEFAKLRKLIDLDTGSSFEISAVLKGEIQQTINPETGLDSSIETETECSGYLRIERDIDKLWNWTISLQGDFVDLVENSSESFNSLEECFSSIKNWINRNLEDFTVDDILE